MVEYSKGGFAAYEIYFTVKTKMPLKCEVSFEIVSGNKSGMFFTFITFVYVCKL